MSPNSIFSCSVKLKSLTLLSRFRFCHAHMTKYTEQLSALKHTKEILIEYPGIYLGLSLAKKLYTAMIPPILPKPTCHADPIARRWWPPRFMLNQHTMTGIAVYAPIATRKSAAYCTWRLSCTLMSIAKPEIHTQIGNIVKKKRCFTLSEKYAINMLNPNAAAQGGTLCSCV